MSPASRLAISGAMTALLSSAWAVDQEDALGTWVAENLVPGEQVLCAASPGSNRFLAARTGDRRLKIGVLIDVDEGLGYPLSFVTALQIADEDGEAIAAPDAPVVVKERYVKVGGEYFAERIITYGIYDEDLGEVRVTYFVERYTDQEQIPPREELRAKDLRVEFECRAEWTAGAE